MVVLARRSDQLFIVWNAARSVLHNGWWLVVSLYLVTDAHLGAAQLVVIAAFQSAAAVIVEVPAGVLADTVSRKWSLVLSQLLMGAAMIGTGVVSGFIPIVATQVLWGISWTFCSGADVAWITDELADSAGINRVLARAARWQVFGAGIGMVVFAGAGALVGKRAVIVTGGICMLLVGAWVAARFPENGFTRVHEYRVKVAGRIAREGVRLMLSDRVIGLLVLTTLLIGGASDVFSRVYPARLEGMGLPAGSTGMMSFGLVSIAGFAIGGLALIWVERGLADGGRAAKPAMIVACVAGAGGLTILATAPSLPLAILGVLIAAGIALPISRTATTIWVNQRCSSRVRATVHSFLSQAEYLGEIICAIAIAGLARTTGASGALGCAAALFLLGLVLVVLMESQTDGRVRGGRVAEMRRRSPRDPSRRFLDTIRKDFDDDRRSQY